MKWSVFLRSSDGCSDYGYLLRILVWILAEMGDFGSDFWARNVVFMLCGSKSVSSIFEWNLSRILG